MTSSDQITVGMETMHIITTIMRRHRVAGGRVRLMKSVFRTQQCVMGHPTDTVSLRSVEINIQFGLKPPGVRRIIR